MKDHSDDRHDAESTILRALARNDYCEDDAWWRSARSALSVKLRFLGTDARWAGSDVLHLQCESGLISDGLLRRGCQVTAVDTRPDMVEAARLRSAAHGYRIDYRHVDRLRNLPFADGRFDIVVCDHVFDRGDRLDLLLEEIGRVLRRDGTLMVACLAAGPLNRIRRLFAPRRWAPGLPRQMGKVAPLQPSRLRRQLVKRGFTPVRQAGLAPRGLPLFCHGWKTVPSPRAVWLCTAMRD